MADTAFMEKLVALCKRRGFIFQSSEIYGGIGGFWDYGPLGVELKRNIKNRWWQDMIVNPPAGPNGRELEMVGLDCSIIMNPQVWVASGHAGGFADPMVTCKAEGCRKLFRADQLKTSQCGLKPSKCPGEHEKCQLTEPRSFNLMFETFVGALQDDSAKAYLRPETAQGIFANYKNVLDTSRVKIPFGIGQVGKAFRNEINPRNYTFRSREFEQMEIEFFCRDEDSMMWYEFWRNTRFKWYTDLGLAGSKLRLRDQTKDELAHYSRACADIEYLFPFADDFQELEGVAHRGCFDLTQHAKHSGKDLNYFDEESWAKFLAERKAKGEPELTKDQKAEIGGKAPYRFLPTVIEPSAGADRGTLAFLCEAYHEDTAPDEKGVAQTRVVMRFHPKLAPVKAAIFPLVNKEGMPETADKLYKELKREMVVQYDDGGAIGRRYRRQDEIGTPFCITIDGETVGAAGATNPGTVTIRERDSLAQHRVAIGSVKAWLKERIGD
ncbi:MAG: glycine--tRNA ligase [Phycisphaerae bacterium]|nr:glycine--tRNA ligase [Phycisphaerae bacterium]